jgi:hypothetical protein
MAKDPGALLNIDKFVNEYKRLVEATLEELNREITILTRNISTGKISDQQRLQVLLAERIRINDFLTNQTTANLNQATQGVYKKIFEQSNKLYKNIGANQPFLETDLTAFQELKNVDYARVVTQAQFDANRIWTDLFRWSITGDERILGVFTTNMDQTQLHRYAETVINTHIDTFSRTVNGVRAVNNGIERFRYDGPPPERRFCQGIWGKVFTLEEIDSMDNGQLGDVFFSGGGYNCRHWWTPVVSNQPEVA